MGINGFMYFLYEVASDTLSRLKNKITGSREDDPWGIVVPDDDDWGF